MPGLDAYVLPIFLIVAAFVAYIILGLIVYSESKAPRCVICGLAFIGREELQMHIKDHESGRFTEKGEEVAEKKAA